MDVWNGLLQGVIQGLTEFLPVSSSGHLSVYQYLTGQSGEAGLMFAVLLHFGTLAAVFAAFWKTIWLVVAAFFRVVGKLFTGRFRFREFDVYERMACLLVTAELPMALAVLLRDFYAGFSTDDSILVEGVCFLLTSVLLFLSTKFGKGNVGAKEMRVGDALIIGAAQAFTPLPGLSRSGTTVSAGLLCGLERPLAVEFSFILGIPPVLGANILEMRDALGADAAIDCLPLVIGVAAAAVVGFAAIRLVQWLVRTDRFRWFALYTALIGLFCIAASVWEWATGVPVRF